MLDEELLVDAACLVVFVVDDLFSPLVVVLFVFCLLEDLAFTVPLPVRLGLVVALLLFSVPLLFSTPLLFLVGCVLRSVELFTPLFLLVLLLLFEFLSTFVFLLVDVDVLPELVVLLFTPDLFGALAGLSVLPEFLVTSGRYMFTELLFTLALPALPELVTFLTETLLPVERSTSCALGPL